jgi:HAD superfamily hydrolase (TIGR01509 family)
MPYHQKAWRYFLKKYHINVAPELFKRLYSGKKNTFILPDLFKKDLSPTQIKKFSQEKEHIYQQLYSPHIKPVAGLLKTLNYLHVQNIPLAVATTAPKSNRELFFNKLKVKQYFKIIVGDEDVTKGKPHPEIYLKSAQKLSINPKNCLVFEDSPAGVQAAKSATMTVVALLTTHPKENLIGADSYIKNYNQLNPI